MKAFRYKIEDGVQLPDEVMSLVRSCRRIGTHGAVSHIDFRAEGAVFLFNDGSTRKLDVGSCRLHNLLVSDIIGEPALRVAYKASGPVAPSPIHSPNGDPRFTPAGPALDPDAAHHRVVKG